MLYRNTTSTWRVWGLTLALPPATWISITTCCRSFHPTYFRTFLRSGRLCVWKRVRLCACVCVCDDVCFNTPPPRYRKHIFRGTLFIVSSYKMYWSMCEYNTFSHLITFTCLNTHTHTHTHTHPRAAMPASLRSDSLSLLFSARLIFVTTSWRSFHPKYSRTFLRWGYAWESAFVRARARECLWTTGVVHVRVFSGLTLRSVCIVKRVFRCTPTHPHSILGRGYLSIVSCYNVYSRILCVIHFYVCTNTSDV